MDSFEWNKIAGAVLFALLVAFGLNIFSELIFETEAPESPGYVVAVAEPGAEGGEEGEAAAQPIGVLLASADPAAGETSARKCVACHTFASGEANKVGPNLYGIVMRPIASVEGYEYSDAMMAFAEQEGTWDYEHLNTYLSNPQGVVPGTKMAFAGLRDDAERANVIAYLRTLAESPEPLPPVEETAEPAEGEAAEAAAPAETEDLDPEDSGGGEAPQSPGEAETQPEAETDGAEAEAPSSAGETAAADAEPAPAQPSAEGAPLAADQEAAETEAPAAEQQSAEGEAPTEGEAAADGEAAAGAAASAAATLVESGDVAAGEDFARRCIACHTFEEGGANRVGPNLWDVVNRPVASIPDYAYSDAMVEFSEGGEKIWDYDTLAPYLQDPRGVVPGTKMVFPGIQDEEDLANVIAYLRSLSAEPAPLAAE